MWLDLRRALLCVVLTQFLVVACRAPLATPRHAPRPVTAAAVAHTGTTPQMVSNQSLTDAEMLRLGAALYATNCAPCHQANGEGNLELFLALNRSAFVTLSAPQPVIDTVLHGREVMPAFAPTLTDMEIAATLSYIRNAWSNEASLISAEQVSEVRAAADDGSQEGEQ